VAKATKENVPQKCILLQNDENRISARANAKLTFTLGKRAPQTGLSDFVSATSEDLSKEDETHKNDDDDHQF